MAWGVYDQRSEGERARQVYRLSPQEMDSLREGDIILRRGYGMVSDYIVKLFDEPYALSHCGLLSRKDGKWQVIHSESSSYFEFEGAQSQELASFVSHSRPGTVMIVRLRAPEEEMAKVTAAAWQVVEQAVVFDYAFDMEDHSQMYCAEMIWKVIDDQLGIDIYDQPGKPRRYNQFANFYDSAHFEVVFNHNPIPAGQAPAMLQAGAP